jgi:hypothetical protein
MTKLIQDWKKSGKNAWGQGSTYNYDMDELKIEASDKETAIQFFDDNHGFGKSGKCPPYVVRQTFENGILTCLATYCGYN